MAFDAGTIEATLKLDRTPFQAGLAAARKEGAQFEGKEFTAKLDAEDRPAKRKLGGLYADMRRMALQRVKPKVDVDAAGAKRDLTGVRRQLKMMPDANVKVNVRTERVAGALAGVLRKVGSFKVTAVASLVALAPAAVMAAVAIGGIGVAAMGVLTPIGLLGIAMMQAFKKGGPEIKAFKQSLAGLKKAFADATGPGAMEAFKGLTSMFTNLKQVMPGLQGGFTKLGKAVGDMFRGFGRQLSSAKFQEFFDYMLAVATKAVPQLGRALRNLLSIFRNITMAGSDLFLRSLKMLADWLGKAAAKTSDIEKMRAVFEKGAEALGKLADIAKGLGGILKAIFTAASEGSDSFLDSIGKTVNKLAEFFQSAKGQKILKDTLASLALFVKEIGAALPTLVRGFGMLLDVVRPIFSAVMAVLKVLEKIPVIGPGLFVLAAGFAAWKGPLGVAAAALKPVSKLLSNIASKAAKKIAIRLGVTTAAEGAAGAAGGAAGQKMAAKGASTAAATAGGAAGGSFLTRFMAKLKGLPGKITGMFKGLKLGGALGSALKAVKIGGPIAAVAGTIVSGITNVIKARGATNKLNEALRTLAKGTPVGAFIPLAEKLGINFQKTLRKVFTTGMKLKQWIRDAAGKVGDVARDFVGVGKKIIKGVAGGIKSAANGVAGALKDAAEKGWKAVKGMAGRFASAGKAVIQAVAKGVKGAAKAVIGAAKDLGVRAWKAIKGLARQFLAAGKAIIEAVAKGVKAVAKKVIDAVKSLGKGALKVITGFASAFFNAGKAIIQKIIDGIKSMAGAVGGAVKGVIGGIGDLLPGSEPRDPSSPLRGLARRGQATMRNIGTGIKEGRAGLVREMKAALAPVKAAARAELAHMDRVDRRRTLPPPTRGQQEAEIVGRINAARDAVDERGVRMDARPPGVARRESPEEIEGRRELEELRRGHRREDLEGVVNMEVKTMIPSDPKTYREVRRGFGRAVGHGRRRRPKRKRKT